MKRSLKKSSLLNRINLTNYVVISQSLVLRSIALGRILIYRNWFIVYDRLFQNKNKIMNRKNIKLLLVMGLPFQTLGKAVFI